MKHLTINAISIKSIRAISTSKPKSYCRLKNEIESVDTNAKTRINLKDLDKQQRKIDA